MITQNNLQKIIWSVGEGETIEFDIVAGRKIPEAANLTGSDSESIQGIPYAVDRRHLKCHRLPNAHPPRAMPDSCHFWRYTGQGDAAGVAEAQRPQQLRRWSACLNNAMPSDAYQNKQDAMAGRHGVHLLQELEVLT